jgi:hypothetical protein
MLRYAFLLFLADCFCAKDGIKEGRFNGTEQFLE